jgi:hypothetical protein
LFWDRLNNKVILDDGSWNAREKFDLYGQENPEGSIISSVKVSVSGKSDTSDNYGLR